MIDLQSLANLGEFVGGFVVVVSVVYLCRQLRQNTRAQRTQNYAVALERIAEFQSRMTREANFADLLMIGVDDPIALPPQQRIQFTWAFYEMFGAFEFIFLQAQAGGMAAEVWERWRGTLQWWMAFPGVRVWWHARPAPFTAAFSRFVDDMIDAGPPDQEAHRRWLAFLAAEPVTRSAPFLQNSARPFAKPADRSRRRL
jgi:hypothetical protein